MLVHIVYYSTSVTEPSSWNTNRQYPIGLKLGRRINPPPNPGPSTKKHEMHQASLAVIVHVLYSHGFCE